MNKVNEPSPGFGSFLEAFRIVKECDSIPQALIAIERECMTKEEEFECFYESHDTPPSCSKCDGSGTIIYNNDGSEDDNPY